MATLELITTDARRVVHILREGAVLGRHASCDIVLADPRVSRTHAEVLREGDAWVLCDLASANGVHVNGRRVRRARLGDGDVVHLGRTRVTVRLTSVEALEAEPMDEDPMFFDSTVDDDTDVDVVLARLRA